MAQTQLGKPKRSKRILPEHYDRVSTMLIAMVPYPMIEKQLSLEWQKSKPYVLGVIKAVHTDWAASSALVADTRRHQIRHSFESLYMKASAAKDVGQATRILSELARLDGCYAPTQVAMEMRGQIGVGISLGSLGFKSPEEVQGRIEYLRSQLAQQGPQMLNAGYGQDVSIAQTLGLPIDLGTSGTNGASVIDVIDIPDTPDDSGGDPVT